MTHTETKHSDTQGNNITSDMFHTKHTLFSFCTSIETYPHTHTHIEPDMYHYPYHRTYDHELTQ